MKKIIFFSLFIFTILFSSGCTKDNSYYSLPSGKYLGWFIDEGTDGVYISVDGVKIDRNTISINGGQLNRKFRTVEGTIGNKNCIGKISRLNGTYIIEGTYSYNSNTGGWGNPNGSVFIEAKGKFKIKSIKD